MSQENVAIVRDALERFLNGHEFAWEMLDENLVVRDHDMPERPEYHGRQGFVRWLADWGEPWAKWTLYPEEYIDAGERVVVFARMVATGRGSGLEIERHDALVYELRDRKTVKLDYFNSREQGLEFAGLVSPSADC